MSEVLSIYCRIGSELTHFASVLPESKCSGFSEKGEYLIAKSSQQAVLYVDDAPLPLDSSGGYWVWQPGFYAGEVAAELEYLGSGKIARYALDVSPTSAKTGRDQYLGYIEEVLDYAPQLLLGTEPARHDLGGRSLDEALWVRYARLKTFIDRYFFGLQSIAQRPCVRQRHYREQIPTHLVRTVDSTSARRLSANPALLNALVCGRELENVLPVVDNRIDIPFSEPTFDNPANRVILQQLKQVMQLTEGLLKTFSEFKTKPSETETDILARLPRRLAFLRSVKKKLLKIARNQPFVSVSTFSAGVAGLNAVSGLPHYAMTHRVGLQLLRRGISCLSENERHYLPPTWFIFESWCFVKLAKELQNRHPEFKWKLAGKSSFVLAGATASNRITLYSQLSCPALMQSNSHGYYSISKNRIPDMVFEYFDGEQNFFVCLDSKYMVRRDSILDAMASAHIYRDSIKRAGTGPLFSILLSPAGHEVPQLGGADYLRSNRVGCVKLENSLDAGDVLDLVWGFIREAGEPDCREVGLD